MAKTQPERVRELEDNLRDVEHRADSLGIQITGFVAQLGEVQGRIDSALEKLAALGEKVAVQAVAVAVVNQRLDEQSRRFDDQAAHVKVWDQRWWGLVAGVLIAIVTAFIRK